MCAVSLLGYFPVRVLVCAELWRWQHSAGSGGNSFSLHKGASEQNNVVFFSTTQMCCFMAATSLSCFNGTGLRWSWKREQGTDDTMGAATDHQPLAAVPVSPMGL